MNADSQPDSICPDCGEVLHQWADGYGHTRGWCKSGKIELFLAFAPAVARKE